MISQIKKLVGDWKYDVVSIGYPGPVLRDRPIADPWNLGKGWAGFNFQAAFRRPVKVVNDAAMQRWEVTRAARCSFWDSGPGLGRRSSSKES